MCYRLSLFHRLKTVKKWLADFPLPLGISLKNCMMCDQLEILNREIERFLHTYTVEGGTLNSVMDSLDIIPASDNGAKYLLEQVFNAMRYSTRVFIISVFFFVVYFSSCFWSGSGWLRQRMYIIPYRKGTGGRRNTGVNLAVCSYCFY